MLTELQIQSFLERPESSLLDFKEEMYNFKNDYEFKETAKFVKDVISFSNTIRVETGYILIGIRETKEFPHEIIGLKNSIDDSILQEKIKDKIFPRPLFAYYEIMMKDKRIALIFKCSAVLETSEVSNTFSKALPLCAFLWLRSTQFCPETFTFTWLSKCFILG